MQKNGGDIDERLRMVENVRLFKQPPAKPGADLMDAKVGSVHVSYVCKCVLHTIIHMHICFFFV